jgi:hypothetical protein
MSVGGVETAAVYLSPQAITPLSASKEPIALALAVRPNLSEPSGASAAQAAEKGVKAVNGVDKANIQSQEKQQRGVIPTAQSTEGVSFAGTVDVYV